MSKPEKEASVRGYNQKWELEAAFKDWLRGNRDLLNTKQQAYCGPCKQALRAHRFDLNKHAETPKHKAAMVSLNINIQPKVTNMGITSVPREAKAIDLQLAIHIALHSSVRSIDHLGKILKTIGKGSPLENFKLHRTKCSKIILNVLLPALLEELVADVGDNSYSLIVDESTDNTQNKFLALCIKYFSVSKRKIVTDLLRIKEVVRTTAEAQADAVLKCLDEVHLKVENMIGLGTDGAAAMCGKHNSLYTRLKLRAPKLQLISCTCHSLHLCSSHASNTLPSCLEYMVRETRAWFSKSPLRKAEYTDLFKAINDGKLPKALVQLCSTRWLAMAGAVGSILDQHLELKTPFNIMGGNAGDSTKCHLARLRSILYNDDSNLLYLIFLRPILDEVNQVNVLFQSEEADVSKLFGDLRILFMSIAKRILQPAVYRKILSKTYLRSEDLEELRSQLTLPESYLPVSATDFGTQFNIFLQKNCGTNADVPVVKKRCREFLIALLKQLAIRLPGKLYQLEAVRYLVPSVCTSRFRQPNFEDLPIDFAADGTSISKLEAQWRRLPLVNWNEVFPENIPSQSADFWAVVYAFTNAGGEKVFSDIALFTLQILSLPVSNAVVERVFSVMNGTKTKSRNRINAGTLEALLRLRVRFQKPSSGCCVGFKPTDAMFIKFNSTIYDFTHGISAPSTADDNTEKDIHETITLLAAVEEDDGLD